MWKQLFKKNKKISNKQTLAVIKPITLRLNPRENYGIERTIANLFKKGTRFLEQYSTFLSPTLALKAPTCSTHALYMTKDLRNTWHKGVLSHNHLNRALLMKFGAKQQQSSDKNLTFYSQFAFSSSANKQNPS
jgi:hypothetical protein